LILAFYYINRDQTFDFFLPTLQKVNNQFSPLPRTLAEIRSFFFFFFLSFFLFSFWKEECRPLATTHRFSHSNNHPTLSQRDTGGKTRCFFPLSLVRKRSGVREAGNTCGVLRLSFFFARFYEFVTSRISSNVLRDY